MGFLLRRTRRPVWVGDTRNRADAVREFERSDRDTDGVSVFEANSEEEVALVVAATACDRQNTGRVDLMEVSHEELERYGPVKKTPEHGTTSIAAANDLHCSLDWGPDTLRRLAEDLFDEGRAPREVPAPAVRDVIRSLDAATIVGEEEQAFVRREQAKPATKKA